MATKQPAPNEAQPTNVSGTDRSYRVPDDNEEAWTVVENALNTRNLIINEDLPVEGKTQVKTNDGRDHVEGLEQYECSDRWTFAFTDAEEKYQPLEMRNARHGGSIIRANEYPVDNEQVDTVRVYFKISNTPSELKEAPGHMEPQLSTTIRNAVKEATED